MKILKVIESSSAKALEKSVNDWIEKWSSSIIIEVVEIRHWMATNLPENWNGTKDDLVYSEPYFVASIVYEGLREKNDEPKEGLCVTDAEA